jgi:hypothetical protein
MFGECDPLATHEEWVGDRGVSRIRQHVKELREFVNEKSILWDALSFYSPSQSALTNKR